MTPFTDDELLSIGPILDDLSAGAHRPITLSHLIDSWAAFVSEVERGYVLTGYDYTNDLDGRDLLARVSRHAQPSLRDKLELVLAPLDSRLRAATRELAEPIRLATPADPSWWWWRVPNDLSGELAMDLLSVM